MKCKIMHLPSATYIYWEQFDNTIPNIEDWNYLYSQYEIENNCFSHLKIPSNIFLSKKQAKRFISSLCMATKIEEYNLYYRFDADSNETSVLIEEHFEIIGINKNEI